MTHTRTNRRARAAHVVLALLALTGPSLAQCDVEWSHASDLLPEDSAPSWARSGTGALALDGTGLLVCTTSASELHYYEARGAAALAPPSVWVIEARLRVVSATPTGSARGPAGISFNLPGRRGNQLWIDDDRILVTSGSCSAAGAILAMDTTDSDHTYRIELDTTTEDFEVFVDGSATPVLTGSLYASTSCFSNEPRIWWGDGTASSSGCTSWRYLRHNAGAGTPEVYGTAKTNSQGCVPTISSSGIPSATGGTFLVTASNVLNQKPGLLFYGAAPRDQPFQGGTLLVRPPLRRTPVQLAGGNTGPDDCSGTYSFDFGARIQSGVDPALTAGRQVFCQWWSRDPLEPGSTTGLTDGLRFAICR